MDQVVRQATRHPRGYLQDGDLGTLVNRRGGTIDTDRDHELSRAASAFHDGRGLRPRDRPPALAQGLPLSALQP
jgi:hypothetical protein